MLQQLAVVLGEWAVLDGRMSSDVLDSLVDSFSMGLPMDGGEVTPVETDKVDDRVKAPKKPDVGEAGRVPETSSLEAPRL